MADGPTPAQRGIFAQILDYENRANPYPFYAQLRRTPVAPQEDGTVVVSSYRAITALMYDPRRSSDRRAGEADERGTRLHQPRRP